MKVLASTGTEEIAMAYIADFGNGRMAEFVESLQPPLPRNKKWVLIVSTLFGCPVGCLICDAGHAYQGNIPGEGILAQIDYLVGKRFPDGIIDVEKFKIQFARMGEPAFNLAVPEVLAELPGRFRTTGLIASVSTIAPSRRENFFERLLEVKQNHYAGGTFQFQFSIHSTDQAIRDRLVPASKWSFAEMAAYGESFFAAGDRKITLNFALARNTPVEPEVLLNFFDPQKFLIKITPLNPTYKALHYGLTSCLDPCAPSTGIPVIEELSLAGYEVLVSIGEVEENFIGSNCGQYLLEHLRNKSKIQGGYSYSLNHYA